MLDFPSLPNRVGEVLKWSVLNPALNTNAMKSKADGEKYIMPYVV